MSHTHPPKILTPEQFAKQQLDYTELLAKDPALAEATIESWKNAGMVVPLEAFLQAVKEAVAPILDTIERVHRDQVRIADALTKSHIQIIELLEDLNQHD